MAKRDSQSEKTLTRKQVLLSRREKEKLRLIYMGLGFVAILIIGVLAIGAFQTYVVEPNAPVAIVNDTEIATTAYQTRARYERFLLAEQYQQILAQQASMTQAGDEELAQMLQTQYQQLAGQVLQQLSVVDRQALDTMIDDLLIQADAAEKGLTVTEAEITEFINQFLARREGGLTAQAASETGTAQLEASATAALWTPTPTLTPSPTLTGAGDITATVGPIETPTPAPTPTFNIIDDSVLNTAYENWLATLSENADVTEEAYRQIIRSLILREKHQERLGEEVPTAAEQAHARHILVETEEEANEVVERLEEGEDFADLAEELSTDPGSAASGGDLGFVSPGEFVGPVDEAVFTLAIGEVSEPVESQFGWHVIEVLEREVRELSPTAYSRSQAAAYEEWLAEARAAAEIEDLWTEDKAPAGSPLETLPQQLPPPVPQGG